MTNAQFHPYEALLVVSFGGPEGHDDVIPFLENVTRGRGVPRERLEEVALHYRLFEGRSPINEQNRAFVTNLTSAIGERDGTIPVYWGNRHWRPFLAEALASMRDDGITRVAAFVTSAYHSYSGCQQYREALAEASRSVGIGAPQIDILRHCFDHPGFISANAAGVIDAYRTLDAEDRGDTRIVFVTHSIPETMASASQHYAGGYVAQHHAVAEAVTAQVAQNLDINPEYDLVYCSRSGPEHTPWLEPDVCDHMEKLAASGVESVVLAPIGFLSDHMEVIYDLDTEALRVAKDVGIAAVRAPTVGSHPVFVSAVVDLLAERAAVTRGESVARASIGEPGPAPDVCGVE